MHKHLLTATMVITCFLFGAGSMYLIDSTWVYHKVERNKKQAERYKEAFEVSNKMVNNAYDAFYTISKCSTKVGCEFVSTANSLTELNTERKILKQKLDQLLDDINSSRSE